MISLTKWMNEWIKWKEEKKKSWLKRIFMPKMKWICLIPHSKSSIQHPRSMECNKNDNSFIHFQCLNIIINMYLGRVYVHALSTLNIFSLAKWLLFFIFLARYIITNVRTQFHILYYMRFLWCSYRFPLFFLHFYDQLIWRWHLLSLAFCIITI